MNHSSKSCSNIVNKPDTARKTKKGTTGPSAFILPDTTAALRDLIEAWGYNPMMLRSRDHAEIAARLGEFLRGKPYSREYVVNILAGRPVGENVRVGIMNLLAVTDGMKVDLVRAHKVETLTECNVHTGALILSDSRLCPCGIHFIPRSWNQKYHKRECKRETR